jgi:hypothetical protein
MSFNGVPPEIDYIPYGCCPIIHTQHNVNKIGGKKDKKQHKKDQKEK